MTRPRIARTARVPALVAAIALTLTGCGLHPGAAAVVGGTAIPDDAVDGAAAALCTSTLGGAEARGEAKPDLASRGARQAALQLLVDAELSRQFAEAEGLTAPQSEVSNAIAQNRQTIDLLPEDLRDDYTDLLRGYAESQLILAEAGRAELGEGAPQEQATAAGAERRAAWAADVDVEVDPRFGDYDEGSLTTAGGSLSVPASDRAVAGNSTEPGADWVAGLPLSQKCG